MMTFFPSLFWTSLHAVGTPFFPHGWPWWKSWLWPIQKAWLGVNICFYRAKWLAGWILHDLAACCWSWLISWLTVSCICWLTEELKSSDTLTCHWEEVNGWLTHWLLWEIFGLLTDWQLAGWMAIIGVVSLAVWEVKLAMCNVYPMNGSRRPEAATVAIKAIPSPWVCKSFYIKPFTH